MTMTTKSTLNTPFSILLVLLTLNGIVAQQNSKLDGWVVLQNSKWKTGKVEYIANAQVRATMSTPTLSDSKGWFSLAFLNVPNGRKVKLSVAKTGLKVVNEKVVEEAAFTGHNEELKIVMCDAADFELAFNNYYQVSQKELQKTYDRRLAVLNRNNAAEKNALLDSMNREMKRAVSTREEAIAVLEEQRKQLEAKAWDLAEAFSVVNLDDQSENYQRAFRAFTEGDIQGTINILNNADIEKNLKDNNRQIALIDSTVQVLSSKKDSAVLKKGQLVKEALLSAQAYSLRYDFNKTQYWYNVAVENDSLNFTILNEYTAYLYDLGEFEKSFNINKITLERARRLRQTADSVLYTEGYAMALYFKALLLSRKATDHKTTQEVCLTAMPLFQELGQIDTLKWLMHGQLMSELAQAYGFEGTDRGDSLSEVWYKNALVVFQQPVGSRLQNKYLFYKSVAHLGLGNTLRYMKRYDEAEAECLNAVAIRRQLFNKDTLQFAHLTALSLTMLAAVYTEKKAFNKAIDTLRKSIEYSLINLVSTPLYSYREMLRAQSRIAEIYVDLENTDSLEVILDSMMIKINFLILRDSIVEQWLTGLLYDWIDSRNHLTTMYLKKQNIQDAFEKARETYEFQPKDNRAQVNYACVLVLNNQYLQAVSLLENVNINKPFLNSAIEYFKKNNINHADFARLKIHFGL